MKTGDVFGFEDVYDEKEERIDVIVLGINIGTASGWDEVEVAHIVFYDFASSIPELTNGSTINFDFQKGEISYFKDEDGTLIKSFDMIEVFNKRGEREKSLDGDW